MYPLDLAAMLVKMEYKMKSEEQTFWRLVVRKVEKKSKIRDFESCRNELESSHWTVMDSSQ